MEGRCLYHLQLDYAKDFILIQIFASNELKESLRPSQLLIAHTYMAEALCHLNSPKEAASHLKSPYLQTPGALDIPPADRCTKYFDLPHL